MNFKKNDLLTVDICDITDLGFGVAKADGAVIFVSDTVPGDKAEIRIIKVAQSYCVARLEKLLLPSAARVGDRCEIGTCKSCAYKYLSYAHELTLKEDGVRDAFKKAGLSHVNVAPIVGSPEVKHYRNKAQYPVELTRDGEYRIGFYAPKSHRVTEAAECPLAPMNFSKILETVRSFAKDHTISVYNEESGIGLLRHVYLRRAEVSGETLLTIVINGDSLPHADELVEIVRFRHPEVIGVLLNVNKKNTNVILGDRFITLYGQDYITDTLGGVSLKITAPSFYQVNHGAAELLYAKAKALADLKSGDTLLDLYCGAGSIGLSMADVAGEVIGIEIVESAVECAKFNARENGIKNAAFYSGDAKNTERMLENATKERGKPIAPDVVILDPPRAGSSEELLHFIARLAPKRIVYVSCNPKTLARDVGILEPLGYTAGEVTPFDLFPATGHVESIVCLTRK